MLPGVLLAIGGTIAAFRSAKRGVSRADPASGGPSLVIVTMVGILAVAFRRPHRDRSRHRVRTRSPTDADLVVDLEDFEFDEDAYEVPAGGTVLVKNDDPFLHTFTIDDARHRRGPRPRRARSSSRSPRTPGTYVLVCEPHTSDPDDPAEDDMASEITVG